MITITSLSQTLSSLDGLSSSALCLVILCLVAGIYSRSGSNEFSPLRACLATGDGENFYVRMMAVAVVAESPSTLGTVSLSIISSVPSPVRPLCRSPLMAHHLPPRQVRRHLPPPLTQVEAMHLYADLQAAASLSFHQHDSRA